MITSSARIVIVATLCLLIPIALFAQVQRDIIPLRSWPAPLYWQPTQAESEAAAKPDVLPPVRSDATAPVASLVFVGMTPCRIADTRTGQGFTGAFGPPSLAGGATRTFPIQSSPTCSVPSIAQAYSFNITVVPPGSLLYITVWPTGQAQPNASTLNDPLGTIIANAAIVPAGASGSINVFASNNTDILIDINGYYAPQTGITLAQGTSGAPSMSFAGDPGTGIFSSGAGTLNIATGGTNRLSLNSNGNLSITGNETITGGQIGPTLSVTNTGPGFATTDPSGASVGLSTQGPDGSGTTGLAGGRGGLTIGGSGGFATAAAGTDGGAGGIGLHAFGGMGAGSASFTGGPGGTGILTLGGSPGCGLRGCGTPGGGLTAFGGAGTSGAPGGFGLSATGGAGGPGFAGGVGVYATGGSGGSVGGIGLFATGGSSGANAGFFQGNVTVIGCVSASNLSCPSDTRLKENITPLSYGLSDVLKLRPVTWQWKDQTKAEPNLGLIAQDVEPVLPELILHNADSEGSLGLNYMGLVPVVVKAIQQQQAQIEGQQKRIAEQQAQIGEQQEQIRREQEQNRKMEERLAALESLLSANTAAAAQ